MRVTGVMDQVFVKIARVQVTLIARIAVNTMARTEPYAIPAEFPEKKCAENVTEQELKRPGKTILREKTKQQTVSTAMDWDTISVRHAVEPAVIGAIAN